MFLLRSIVLWLLNHPQHVLGVFLVLTALLIWTKKKWRRKQPFLPWILAMGFVAYIFVFIRFFDRIDLLRPVLSNATAETLSETAIADDQTYCFGIDVSQYQGQINWDEVLLTKHPLRFVIARASMGTDGQDPQFAANWQALERIGLQRGAYHYYRPFQNSTEQARNFINLVQLKKGDFPPVLDVEKMSPFGAANLREGVQNWLRIVGQHYRCKPIVYTGRFFYERYLKGSIDGYPLWVASYGPHHKVQHLPWTFYQFSEKMVVHGINSYVDGNFFQGSLPKLRNFGL
jgi:GH25 family lysozyme M1 (1,4-beta-N-acetylmuramidase)